MRAYDVDKKLSLDIRNKTVALLFGTQGFGARLEG